MSRTARPTESPLDLTLVQGIVKGDKLEGIIRMATELGVCRVAPVVTERTIARAAPARWPHRLERWRRVAKEAAKQSGRAVHPRDRAAARRSPSGWRRRGRRASSCASGRARRRPRRGPARRRRRARERDRGTGGRLQPRRGGPASSRGRRRRRTRPAHPAHRDRGPVALALLQSRYGDLGARA